jgi:hypothetical protein
MTLKDEYKEQREEINHEMLLEIRDLLRAIKMLAGLNILTLILIMWTMWAFR